MPELAPQERLQPSLLDRLTDDQPGERTESRDQRVLSMRRLRESVLRDLAWLMNADNLAQTQDLTDFPHAAASTLNYGLRDIAGLPVSTALVSHYEREVRQAILDFEPRILPSTLQVRAVVASDRMDRNTLSFVIEGDMWADPVPMRVLLKSDVNVESGEATVTEDSDSRAG